MGEFEEEERKEPPRNQGRRLSEADLFQKMDSNKDNKLSKVEVKGPLADHFSGIDKNKDGFITKDELKKLPKPKNRR